jgi:predicted membrane protein
MAYSKHIIISIKDKIILGVSIGAALVLGVLLAGGHLYSTLKFSEIASLLTIWALLLVIGAVACGFIGILVMMLIGSTLAKEVVSSQKGGAEKNDVLISVMTRTPNDAKDIAREWEEIGGEVV